MILVGLGLTLMHGIEVGDDWTALLAGFDRRRDRHRDDQPGDRLGRDRRSSTPPAPGWRRGSTAPSARSGSRPAPRRSARSSSRGSTRSSASCCRRRRTRSPRPSPPGATQSAVASVPPGLRERAAEAANQAFVSGLNEILLVGAAIAFAGGIASWLLVRRRDLVGAGRRSAEARRAAGAERRRLNAARSLRFAAANPSAPAAKTGGVLHELRIENLLLIERAELRLEPGLNAITGETGAGKTVLAHSLDLLMGGRARPQIVRPGAEEAWVEGVFALPAGLLDDPELAEIAERLPEDADEVVLGRRIGASGRTSAFIGGRSASAAELRALGSRLLAFYGQHEHRRLTLASAQLEILDGFGGPSPARAARPLPRRRTPRSPRLARELAELREREGSPRARPRPDAVRARRRSRRRRPTPARRPSSRPSAPCCETPRAARRRRRGRSRRSAATRGRGRGARGARRGRGRARRGGRASTPSSTGSPSGCARRRVELDDAASGLRGYLDGIDAEPGRLEAVEERLDAFDRLKRKHGGTIEAVLEHADRCRAEIERLENAEEVAAELEARIARGGGARARGVAAKLGAARRKAAGELGQSGSPPSSPSWRWTARGSRSRSSRTPTASGPTAPRPSSSWSPPTRACRPRRSRTRPRAASSRGSCSRSPASRAVTASARWCSTRSTPGSAATPRAPWASGCGASRDGRPGALHHPPAAGRRARAAPTSGSRSRRRRRRHDGDGRAGRGRRPGRRDRAHARRRARRLGGQPPRQGAAEGGLTSPPLDEEIGNYYGRGDEARRLDTISRLEEPADARDRPAGCSPPAPANVLDVGGGPGAYAFWLAELGYAVHLSDPVPLHVEAGAGALARGASTARQQRSSATRVTSSRGTATVDGVLMLGPLYHLTERADRVRALGETRRVLRPGAPLIAAAHQPVRAGDRRSARRGFCSIRSSRRSSSAT